MNLKEEITGTGDVLENSKVIGKATYNLYIYQEIHESNNKLEEGHLSINGNINTDDDYWNFYNKVDLILHLEDGRYIKFNVKNTDGEIQCSGSFFKKNDVSN